MRSWMVVLFAAACGGGSSGSGHLPDAPPGSDAAIDGAADSPVALTVTSGGAPVASAHVYFLGADGTLVKTADTGADGTASAVMAAGGSVTVLDPFPLPDAAVQDDFLITFMAVKPGDHLRLSNSERAQTSLALTARSATDATSYDVFTTCGTGSISSAGGGTTASGTLDDLRGCHGTADIAIVANKGSTAISGLYHTGVPVDGSPVTIDDMYGPVSDFTVTYTHVPAGLSLRMSHAPLVAHGRLGPFDATVTGANGSFTATTQEPATDSLQGSVMTLLDPPSGAGGGEHQLIEWGTPLAPFTLDLSGVLVRAVGPPSYDFTAGAVVWSEEADGAAPDAITTLVGTTRTAPARKWQWLFVAPYTGARLAPPRLPTDVADFTPVAGDAVSIDSVTLYKLTDGYDGLRTRNLDIGENNERSLIVGQAGHIATFISDSSAPFAPGGDGSRVRRRVLGRAAR